MVETSTLAPPFNGYWVQGHFPFVKRPEREIDHLALMPRLRISGAIPLFPHMPSYMFSQNCVNTNGLF
jgi:hypothetical protein